MTSFFDSPVWFERRTLILKILNEHKNIKKVIINILIYTLYKYI